jgi:L-asparaginase/Glu-tRNA(Gln) amidotransferase subunit D
MSSNPTLQALQNFGNRHNRPVKIGLYYTGGTFACFDSPNGLQPIEDEIKLEKILGQGLGLCALQRAGFLEYKVHFLFSMDSTNIEEKERDEIVKAISVYYDVYDGAILIHGTDTGAETGKHLHLAMPYNNPLATSYVEKENWRKPAILLSSQLPGAISLEEGIYLPALGSDGQINLATSIIAIADEKVGEAGYLTNGYDLLQATASTKVTENGIPPYKHDEAVAPVATLTALGMRYNHAVYGQKKGGAKTPLVITDSSAFKSSVLCVTESQHLSPFYIVHTNGGEKGVTLTEWMKETDIPRVVIYQTRGAGNVPTKDAKILEGMGKDYDAMVFTTPIPGGRIPQQHIYATEGAQFNGLNMQMQTAKIKSMLSLSLAESYGLRKGKDLNEFVCTLMKAEWGSEFLPER